MIAFSQVCKPSEVFPDEPLSDPPEPGIPVVAVTVMISNNGLTWAIASYGSLEFLANTIHYGFFLCSSQIQTGGGGERAVRRESKVSRAPEVRTMLFRVELFDTVAGIVILTKIALGKHELFERLNCHSMPENACAQCQPVVLVFPLHEGHTSDYGEPWIIPPRSW